MNENDYLLKNIADIMVMILSMDGQLLLTVWQSSSFSFYWVVLVTGLVMFLLGVWLRPYIEKLTTSSPAQPKTSAASQADGLERYHNPVIETVQEFSPEQLRVLQALFETEYRQSLIDRFEHVPFWSMDKQEHITLQREAFFVDPQFHLEGDESQRLHLKDLLQNFKHLILLGPSGCGKTETIFYLMLTQARQQAKKRLGVVDDTIPVLLSAPALASALGAMSNFPLLVVLQQHFKTAPPDYVKTRLEQGKFIILLDSLNEIYISDAEKIIEWFDTQIGQYPDNRLIIAARPALMRSLNQLTLTTAKFADLTASRYDRFSQKWQSIIPNVAETIAKILASDETYALAHTPLNLLMILTVSHASETLPIQRTQLYPMYLDALFAFESEVINEFSAYQKRTLLQNLAFTFHQRHQIFMDRSNLGKVLRGIVQVTEESAELFVELSLESGVLVQVGDESRFNYLNLQEFLVAREIVENNLHYLLAKQGHDLWWEEVKNFYQELTDTTPVINRLFTEESRTFISGEIDTSQALVQLQESLADVDNETAEIESLATTKAEESELVAVSEVEDGDNEEQPEKSLILVVDDTPQNLKFARFILERGNYEVAEATDGVEAVEWLKTNTPTLILSDIQMPNMNGYEFCEHVQTDERLKTIPFIFVTAFSRASKEIVKGLKMGANDYIPRPFAPEELLARIDANVRVRKAEEAMREQSDKLARRNRELALLNDIQHNVTISLNLDNVLDTTLQEIQTVTQAESTSLWFVDRENQSLMLAASFNPIVSPTDIEQRPQMTRLSLQKGLHATVVEKKKPFLSTKTADKLGSELLLPHTADAIGSLVCVPLKIRERTIGVIEAAHRALDQFSPDDLSFLTSVADTVTIVIENAWLFGQIRGFNQQLEQMVEARTRELLLEKEKTDTILVSIADGLLVTDPDKRIMRGNPAMEALLEANLSKMGGVPINHPNFVSPLWELIRRIHEQDDDTYTEAIDVPSTTHKDKIFSFQASAARMLSEHQANLGTVIALRDVTALQEVDRMKANFMTGITHELKTPLAIITLQLGGLLKYYDRLDDARKMETLHKIGNATELLSRLVDSILELSKLDSGMQKFQFTELDLVDMGQRVVNELQPLADKKSLDLTFHVESDGPIIIDADNNQLERVIRNLVENGIKYTPEGKVAVQLIKDERAIFEVTDTGIGLTEEQIEKLFERFYRADNQRNILGTGLGLSIAEEIVKEHRGKIIVTSQIGEGSTFRVTLPLKR